MNDQPGQQHVLRIGLVATDEVRVSGLRALLGAGREGEPNYELVLLDKPKAMESAELQLVLIDAGSTEHVFELLATFRRHRPRIRLVVIAGQSDELFLERAIDAGARGVLHYTVSERELRMAVAVVADGSVWAPRRVISRLLDRAHGHPAVGEPVELTSRELEVLALLVRGLPNRLIADELGIKPATVKAHMGRLMRKAGVSNRTALGMHALAVRWLAEVQAST